MLTALGTTGIPYPVLFAEFAFSLRRAILRAAFFSFFSFRAQAFCRFLNVSIRPLRLLFNSLQSEKTNQFFIFLVIQAQS